MLKNSGIEQCFDEAIANKSSYIAIELQDGERKEIVLINNKDFKKNKEEIIHRYDKWLRYLGFKQRKIIGCVYGDTKEEVLEKIKGVIK